MLYNTYDKGRGKKARMTNLNVVHHMNEFKNVLSYSSKIGFFFGAGSSCAFGLPNIITLTKEVKNSLDDNLKSIYDKASQDIFDLNRRDATIEDVLNYLRQISDLTNRTKNRSYNDISGEQAHQLDKEICHLIYNIIKQKQELSDIKELRKFFAWYDAATSGFIKEVFTTNYDMLLEMAMEANCIPYFDGFVGSFEPFFNPESIDDFPNITDSTGKWIRLWKIHGSLNWTLKKRTIDSSDRIVRGSISTEHEHELMIYPSREKYALSRREPYIAYFDRLKKYMMNGESLFIISGYSFSDQHINDIIYNAMRHNPRLYVVVTCYDDLQVEKMEGIAASHLNLCVMGPKKVIANGTISSWIYDDSSDNAEGHDYYWDISKQEMILGDFKKLISFLVDNSGRKSIIEEIANAR